MTTKYGIDKKLINRLVEIGKKHKKTPWCCCSEHELIAFKILNSKGHYPQATYKESKDWE